MRDRDSCRSHVSQSRGGPRALGCLQCLLGMHCLHYDRRLVPIRFVTIQYEYKLPAPANLKGEVVTAGNARQGEPSLLILMLILLSAGCIPRDLFVFRIIIITLIHAVLYIEYTYLYSGSPAQSSTSLTRSGQLSFPLLRSTSGPALENLPYRGFASTSPLPPPPPPPHLSSSLLPTETTLLIYRNHLVSPSGSLLELRVSSLFRL